MNILLLLVPLALLLVGLGVWGFAWAVRKGQYDDVHTPAMRMLVDDEEKSELRIKNAELERPKSEVRSPKSEDEKSDINSRS